MPDDGLIGQLETRRASLIKANRELLSAALAANDGKGRDLTAEEDIRDKETRAEIGKLRERIDDLRDEAQREERARQARAGDPGVADDHGTGARASGVQVTSEPVTYSRYQPQRSFFLDLARSQLSAGRDIEEARARITRHQQELDAEMPKRREAREKAASARTEQLMAPRSRREERALERFYASGVSMFEKRAINRVDGSGGYFVPPLWLIDEYIPYLRAGRVFADQWTGLPLPGGTDSINLPRIVLGTAVGPQAADGGPVGGRDITDNFVQALVRTVAGQQDAAIQLLDQSPIAFDQVIFKDLMADHAMNLSSQLLVGSGANGQLTGVFPNGIITGASTKGFHIDTVTQTTAATQWAGTGTSFYSGVAQLISQISRKRFRPPSVVVTNPAAWYAMAASTDTTNRPFVMPAPLQGTAYNPLAADTDGPVTAGPVGHILGVPWVLDPNVPLTFGGATSVPLIGAVSQGNVGPIDGTGAGNTFTPAISAVADDLYLWEGEVRTRVLQEVLSGTLQVRFQVYSYCADMPNRYQDSNGNYLSYGNANSASTAGAALSTGASGGLVNF